MPGGRVGLLLHLRMTETRSMDGELTSKSSTIRSCCQITESQKTSAGSLQQPALYPGNKCVKILCILCTPPQAQLPLSISGTHSQSNTGLKPWESSLIPLFHIPHHQIMLALSPKYPKSEHFSTPPPLIHVILFCLNYYSDCRVSSLVTCFSSTQSIFYIAK